MSMVALRYVYRWLMIQPTLRRRMKLGVLAALDQRIGLRYAMPPMTAAETGSY
jgi:type II secretory pathway predicted ATPase ExeA